MTVAYMHCFGPPCISGVYLLSYIQQVLMKFSIKSRMYSVLLLFNMSAMCFVAFSFSVIGYC